jgi:hypothetical protein
VFYYFYLLIFIDWKLKLKTLKLIFIDWKLKLKTLKNISSLSVSEKIIRTRIKSRLFPDITPDITAGICYIQLSNCK